MVLGLMIGVGVLLALLLLPVNRLWLVTGPFLVVFGVVGLVFVILVETGMIAGRRVPVPVAVLAIAVCVVPVYNGVRKIRAGLSEWRSERRPDFRPPHGY